MEKNSLIRNTQQQAKGNGKYWGEKKFWEKKRWRRTIMKNKVFYKQQLSSLLKWTLLQTQAVLNIKTLHNSALSLSVMCLMLATVLQSKARVILPFHRWETAWVWPHFKNTYFFSCVKIDFSKAIKPSYQATLQTDLSFHPSLKPSL